MHPDCSRTSLRGSRELARSAAHVLLFIAAMRSLPLRALLVVLPLTLTMVLVGCGASPETTGGGGAQDTYGAEITPGEEADDEAAGDVGDDDGAGDTALLAVDDTPGSDVPTQTLAGTTQVKTTANVNLRKGPGTSYAILAVIPAGTVVNVVDATPKSGFLNVKFNGTAGWSSATYLAALNAGGGGSSGTVDLDGPPSPENTMARAKKAVGFSYYWGGGAWLPEGPSASTKGSCSGSCPSCSHSGRYGADCSGLVAKAWQYGTKALEVNSHPYSTASFNKDVSGKWSTVSRGALRKGDALVYNSNGAGHIVIYEKGDGWGTPTVVECRGCSYGCVYNARSFTSNYHGIRRAGF